VLSPDRRFSLKQRLGACIYDLPRFLWATRQELSRRAGVAPWIFFRNRAERLIPALNGLGVQCDWQWTSDLHITKVFPSLGRMVMKRALRDCPIGFQKEQSKQLGKIDVSFIIGHRGLERLPHLLLTLQSVAAQRDVSVECMVVEQSATPEVKDHLPSWVRYVHTALPYADMPYSRSWALNVGARLAVGKILVLHDNDMLVPQEYASQVIRLAKDGFEVMNVKRFIFYLGESHSIGVMSGHYSLSSGSPDSVVQNLEAGGNLAITRDAFFGVGGFDESFVGWGGEDNEFWERAQTRRLWPYGYLPLIHLWHPAQVGKMDRTRSTAALFEARSAISPAERIAELTSRDFGNPQFAPQILAAGESSFLNA
jgi:glycosyl transferase family 7 (putative galactosyltransferase)